MSEQVLSVITMDKLNTRRRELIKALRSGKYPQGRKALLCQDLIKTESSSPFRVSSPGTQKYCCLGVGMTVADSEWLTLAMASDNVEYDPADDYDRVRTYYNIDHKLMNYLMGMNDGDMVEHPDRAHKMIRYENFKGRDFKFIARFLEVVWSLK